MYPQIDPRESNDKDQKQQQGDQGPLGFWVGESLENDIDQQAIKGNAHQGVAAWKAQSLGFIQQRDIRTFPVEQMLQQKHQTQAA